MKKLLITLWFFASWPIFQAHAAVPQKITYQGNLRQSGALVTGTRTMVFRLYASSNSAAALWTSSSMSVVVSTGIFRVTLEPSGIDWESTNPWLETQVEGTTLSPRDELTAVPYAINSLLHSGKRYTNSAIAPSSPGLGDLWFDTSANTLKFWNGSAWTSASGSGSAHAITHSGAGSDPITSLGAYTLTGNITMNSGTSLAAGAGNPGISVSSHLIVSGTINPSSNLNIGGAGFGVTFASAVTASWFYGNGSGLTNINAAAPANMVTLDTAQTLSGAKTFTNTLTLDAATALTTSNQEGLTITTHVLVTSGNIGAGTAFPSRNLSVQDPVNSTAYLSFMELDFERTVIGSEYDVNARSFILYDTWGGAYRVIVTTNGDVGIGADFPAAKLDVAGSAQFGSTAKSTFTAAGALNIAANQNITLSGTGKVTGLATPTAASDAATKGYVDAASPANMVTLDTTQTISGVKTFTSTLTITAQDSSGYSLKLSSGINMPAGTVTAGLFVGNGSGLTNITASDSTKVLKAGDTMTGTLTINAATALTTSNQEGLTITTHVLVTSGNIGAGTAFPSRNLSVQDPVNSTAYLSFMELDFERTVIGSEYDVNARSFILYDTWGGAYRVIVTTNGDVGIGADFPAAKLDVAGSAQFGSTAKSTFTAAGALNMAADQNITLSGTGSVLVSGSGNVGVGTASPQSALQVASGYIQFPFVTVAPNAADCNEATEAGRMTVFANTTTAGDAQIYVCDWDDTNGGAWTVK